ncbi:MAG: hypothetical protein OXQ94_12595 [Gemmatimonadota bacterium]|nr:hypothetical protein [Gemmatimonadota bacterium]MDE2872511.1 hypothetical protein [Gemmatimonadota bacterium]
MLAHHVLPGVVPALVAMFLAVGCEEDPVKTEPPPDLTGTYDLLSLQYPNNPPVGPPVATGTFSVEQTSVEGQEATGTFAMDVTISTPPLELTDKGSYSNRFDGTWEQSGALQTKGTYTFSNDTLAVVVTEPPLAVSTTIWKRR